MAGQHPIHCDSGQCGTKRQAGLWLQVADGLLPAWKGDQDQLETPLEL